MDKKITVFPTLKSMIGSSFITITLKPDHYERRLKVQYGLLLNHFMKYVRRYFDEIVICPELTKKSNIHLHAIGKWTTRVDYPEVRLLDDIRTDKYIGMIYITPNKIQNEERAKAGCKYMLEDYDKTRSLLLLPEIITEWKYIPEKNIKKYTISIGIDGLCEECEEI